MGFHLVTKKGYSLFEVSSALQKEIRRANEREALYWAYELESSNFGAYLWKRLLIISMEDIGPAEPNSVVRLTSFKAAYEELRKKKSKEVNLAIAAAVVYLSRCEKSRLYDWAKCLMVDTHGRITIEVPAYALDMHTSRGRARGMGIEQFFSDGCLVTPHRLMPGETEYMAETYQLYSRPKFPETDFLLKDEPASQSELFDNE